MGPLLLCLLILSFRDVTVSAEGPDSPSVDPSWLRECHQTPDHGLNCSALSLHSLPAKDLPDFITSLDLTKNSLPEHCQLPFGENLQKLSLKNNEMKGKINWRFDEKLPRLEELDLSENKVTHIPIYLPAHLKVLDMNKNTVESLDDILLNNELEELFLSGNTISGSVELCSETPHLDLHCTTAHLMRKLDLSDNDITGVISKGLQSLTGLEVLSLATNNIESLQKSTFHGLRNLQLLDLSDNQIISIHDKTFERLKNLKYLYLRRNKLVSIPSKLPLLEWLDVSYNNIEKVNETIKSSLYPIEMVNMGHNPFHCDCHMLWLKEWYDRREYIIDYSVDIPPDEYIPLCGSPDHVAGEHWDVLDDRLFICEPEQPKDNPHQIDNPNGQATPKMVNQNGDGAPGIDNQNGQDSEEIINDTEKYISAYDLHVQIRSVHPTMIKLEWRAPNHYTNLLIQYFKTDDEEETTLFAQIQATQGHHVLKNLDPGSSYKICVIPKSEVLTSVTDINDCLGVRTPGGEGGGGGGGGRIGGFTWFQVDHTLESKFKMIFACFFLSLVLVGCGVALVEVMVRLCSHPEKEHTE